MALTFQGMSKTDIMTGVITKIEIAIQAGSPSYTDAGDFTPPTIDVRPLTMPSDPAGSELVYALEFAFSFDLVQTKKTAELAAMAGTSGTGLYETDVQIKFTYATARTLTLGAVTASPLRIVLAYSNGPEGEAQRISCTGRNVEGISTLAAKVG